MSKKIIIEEFGGADQLKVIQEQVGEPGPNEVRIAHKACGLNFIDIYQRTGLYPMPLPHTLGTEAAGLIDAVGSDVTHLKTGDRVAYAFNAPAGAYCEMRVMPADQVCVLPESISFEEGAAMMLKGLTVQYLFHRTTPLKAGDTVLFHAAAGGVGLIACQWAKSEGITLIGTAGSDEKCQRALNHGAAHCINYQRDDFLSEVKKLTNGVGVDVVMDSVGADTFDKSLACLKPFGMMITFGNSSGKTPPFDLAQLAPLGSLKITRPSVFTHIAQHETCQTMARHLFDKVTTGAVKIRIDQRFALQDVAAAHLSLESRETMGSTVLTI